MFRILQKKMTTDKLTLGLWALGNSEGFHSKITAREAKDIIKTAYKKGIHSFDSAFSYNTDNLLYSALREMGVKTEDVEVFEKVMPYKSMRKKVEASLRALRTEHLTSLIIHWPSAEEQLFSALKDAEGIMEEGKCSSIGISNFPHSLARRVEKDFQISYNEYFSAPTFPSSPVEGLRNLKYGIFSFGSLLKDDMQDARKDLFYHQKEVLPSFLSLKRTIDEIAKEKGASRKEILISFALYDNPHRIIIGAGRKEHLDALEAPPLEERYYSAIMEEGMKVASYNESDNVFSHNWRGR